MFKVLIIDDEALARRRIQKLLPQWEDLQLLGECRNGAEALSAIREKKPDLIFLDIHMKDMTGFEVLSQLKEEERPLTIFVTAYDQYAIRAFDVFAFDYLLKPFKDDRFALSVEKARATLLDRAQQQQQIAQLKELIAYLQANAASVATAAEAPKLALKHGSKVSLVAPADIRYIEASGYYIEVFTQEKRILLRESMQQILEQLDQKTFLRIHRSTIINMQYLAEIQHVGSGDVEVRMKDGKRFRVSKSYREELFNQLKS
jgi:two-component system LytT family response regulator